MEVPFESFKPSERESYIIFLCSSIGLFLIFFLSLISYFPNKINKYIDLHLHLDGAITLNIAKELALLQNITLPTTNDTELETLLTVEENNKDLNQFLQRFELPVSLLQTKKGLTEGVRLVAENIYSQGVIYAEIKFAPQLHTNKGLSQEEVVLAALEGLKKTPMKVNLILCFMRGVGNEDKNEETLELAKKYLVKDGGVVAVDLAGAEAIFKTSNYKNIFAKAKSYGIPYTIHAGEADGPDSIKSAIEFGARRIGHGVTAFRDQSVVKLIKEKGIFVEMCPTSNKQTHAVPDMSEYPFMDYLKQDIKVTLNTDDMGIEGTTLAKEFEYMEKEFNLNYEQEKKILLNSIDAAFTTEEIKAELRKKLNL